MKRLEFASHPGNLALVRNFVRDFLSDTPLPSLETDLIVLGVDEACTNIMRHAYNEEHTHLIALTCEKEPEKVRIRLRDYGEQGDPERMKGRELDDVAPGGLGLHFMRKAFDEVNFCLKKSGTELVLVKRLPQI
jgi:anti-sigma regulatory factor (Ser/Thr protein kinase)